MADRQGGSNTPGTTGLSLNQLNLPTPRLVLLVCRGLALACVDVPVLPVVLAGFLAPGAPSVSLAAVVVVPPVALEPGATLLFCCFLAGESRGRAWFVRAGGFVTHVSEQFRSTGKEKVHNL